MSTSDRDPGAASAPRPAPQEPASGWGAAFAALASDPALIGRIANELFAAPPGAPAQAAPGPAAPGASSPGVPAATPSSAAAPASFAPAPAVPAPPASPPPSGMGQLSEADLRALPATLAGPVGASSSPPPAAPTPSLQGTVFYFLEKVDVTPPRVPPALPFQGIQLRPEAVPGQPTPPTPTSPVDPALLVFSPAVPPAAAASPPGEGDLRSGPGSLAGAAGVPSPLQAAPPAPPAFPGGGFLPFTFVEGEKASPPRAAAPSSGHEPRRDGPLVGGAPGAAPRGAAGPHGAPPREFRPEVMPDAAPEPAPPSRSPAHAPFAVPGTSFYFLDEGQTGLGRASPPARLASLELRPDFVPDLGLARRPFDPHAVRRDFPILQEEVHGRPLIWLDNAATTQKPNAVIDRLSSFYRHEYSNIHRASHAMAARATDAYEGAREKVRRFLHASSTGEIVFVRGTTEGVNLVAQTFGRRFVEKDDEIVITWLEHHANIVPWQLLCAEKGARLRVAPVDDTGQVILEEYEKLLGPRTRLVALSHVSNALGTITPAREMVAMAHRHGARVLVDGAQAVSHFRVDVQDLDCDFYVLSGHKVFAPSGIGVVYGKADVLETMPPWQGGGNMISCVSFEKTTYQPPPARFEAGTPSIADAVGLGAALDYFESVGIESAAAYEHALLQYATAGLQTVPGLRLIGTAREKASVLSFVLEGFRSEDVGSALDKEGIALRAGHHCAQPILRRFGVEATVRPSLAFYNTCEDVDALVAALHRLTAGRAHRGT